MNEEQYKELLEKFKADAKPFVEGLVESAAKGLITSEALKDQLSPLAKQEDIDKLTETVDKQGLELLKFGKQEQTQKSVGEIWDKNLKGMKEALDAKTGFTLQIPKSLITKDTVLRSAVTDNTMAYRVPGIGQVAYGTLTMPDLFTQQAVGNDHHGVIRYTDQEEPTRNAAMVAEGGTMPESAQTWIEKNITIKKMMDSIPVSYEALNDIAGMEAELRRLLNINLMILANAQYWNGTGTGNNIKGVYTSASAWDFGSYAGTKFQNANLYDLLVVLREQNMNGKQSKYNPNYAVMNGTQIRDMKLTKDDFGNYVMPPFVSQNGQVVDGMIVYENSVVTDNTLLIGDMRYGTRYVADNIEIEVGWSTNDFEKDLIRLKARERSCLLIRDVDADGFLKVTDVNGALNAINKPSA